MTTSTIHPLTKKKSIIAHDRLERRKRKSFEISFCYLLPVTSSGRGKKRKKPSYFKLSGGSHERHLQLHLRRPQTPPQGYLTRCRKTTTPLPAGSHSFSTFSSSELNIIAGRKHQHLLHGLPSSDEAFNQHHRRDFLSLFLVAGNHHPITVTSIYLQYRRPKLIVEATMELLEKHKYKIRNIHV